MNYSLLARDGDNFELFGNATLQSYQFILEKLEPNTTLKPDQGNVQQVLMALQEKTLVWKASRGVYALEDSGLDQLLEQPVLALRPG